MITIIPNPPIKKYVSLLDIFQISPNNDKAIIVIPTVVKHNERIPRLIVNNCLINIILMATPSYVL